MSILPHWFIPSLLPLHLVGTSNFDNWSLRKVGKSIIVVCPPHPCIVVSCCRRWVRASGSVFEANGKGCGGKVSTRELLSLSLSLSAGHLTCGGLAIIVWWGPCRLSVIGHPLLHLSSSSIIVVVACGGKAREVGDVIHPPHRGIIIIIIIIVVIIWWGHHCRPSPPLCVIGHPGEVLLSSSFPMCCHHCCLSPTLHCLVRASSSIIVIGT